ncbi:hypothetical protein [Rhabdothermincola salaria]|uniref:hypothetical protein n=1 Tax=Rhabdothermincola salaria TaxID=2903142 RepID=UPI001E3EBE8B|nr:hypothetical protein [Rhabdothermincola salaria]MCD9624116.1 hypothetical protein [Rhabdothermincola salaria]
MATDAPHRTSSLPVVDGLVAPAAETVALERHGRRWLLWSFLLCPCHLPLSLGVLATVLAGTSAGALVRDHAWVAGGVLTLTWVLGTGYGFHLIRRAQRSGGACPSRPRRT